MPKVEEKTKSAAGKAFACCRCSKPIVKGQKYYQWSFFRAAPTRAHSEHGYPRQSMLTRSKMSGVYSAMENIEDQIAACRKAESLEGLVDAINDAADEIESVRDEYQDGYDNMPDGLQQGDTGQAIDEKINALTEFADSLRSSADNVPDEIDTKDDIESALCDVESTLNELSI